MIFEFQFQDTTFMYYKISLTFKTFFAFYNTYFQPDKMFLDRTDGTVRGK